MVQKVSLLFGLWVYGYVEGTNMGPASELMFDYQVWAYLEGSRFGPESWGNVCFSSVGSLRGD